MATQQKYIQLDLFQKSEDNEKELESSVGQEYDLTDLFARLAKSDFRSRFHLTKKDKEYIAEKGLPTIRRHAEDFIAKRLAQHATGCCCRGCFYKWHHIPAGRELTKEEQQYAVAVLMTWIETQNKH